MPRLSADVVDRIRVAHQEARGAVARLRADRDEVARKLAIAERRLADVEHDLALAEGRE